MIITRFAPSPTGYLHIGSVRTALFCWLWSKRNNGKFILRIEDTDRERSTEEAVQVILDGLKWLNLDWDEGPIYQTARFDRYQAMIEQLLAEDKAYKCYCSKERLDDLRQAQMQKREKPRYDGHCLTHAPADPNAPHVIRFKTPQTGSVSFDDMVRGHIEIQNSELDDLIIARTDGTPTYNFTVVIDDWDMGVTQVLRGDDHINNTPRQIHIFQAFGASVPEYGHMPMLLGPDGKRLSKRHGAENVLSYRDHGILPEALINYLVRLGWSHQDQEIFTRDEMCALFDAHNINVAPTAINPEKLLWLNQHYMKTLPEAEIATLLASYLDKIGVDYSQGPDLKAVVLAQRERCKTMVEMAERSRFWFDAAIEIDNALLQKHFAEDNLPVLQTLLTQFQAHTDWTPDAIDALLKALVSESGLKFGKIAQPLRVAMTGGTVSPPIGLTLSLLAKEKTVERLQHAIHAAQKTLKAPLTR